MVQVCTKVKQLNSQIALIVYLNLIIISTIWCKSKNLHFLILNTNFEIKLINWCKGEEMMASSVGIIIMYLKNCNDNYEQSQSIVILIVY